LDDSLQAHYPLAVEVQEACPILAHHHRIPQTRNHTSESDIIESLFQPSEMRSVSATDFPASVIPNAEMENDPPTVDAKMTHE